jgi:autotransporter-associated beta strand protein
VKANSKRTHLVFILIAGFVYSALPFGNIAQAAVKTWDGSANGLLSNPANWSGGIAPVEGDDLVFPASGVTQFNVTNNILGGPRFRSISFEGNSFTLSGAFMVLSNGIGAQNLNGINRVNCAIQLAAAQTFFINGDTGASLDINGDVNLGSHSLTVSAGGGDLFMSGVISGTGGISKISGGTVRFDGAEANTYTGTTTVIGGTLELNKGLILGIVAVPGNLTLGASGPVDSDVVRLLRSNQIASDSDVTVGQAGLLDLNGSANGIGSLTMNGGRVAGGTLTLNGNVTATSVVGSTATISGSLLLGSSTRTFTVNNNLATDPDLDIDAAISGNPGIVKAGAGTLAFSGSASNTYVGGTRVTEGTLLLRRSFFDRSILGNLLIGDGVGPAFSDVVRIEDFAQINNLSAVTIASSGLFDLNGISETVGSLSGAGRVEVGPNNLDVGRNGASTTYSGEIIGSGALTKTGLGTLTLTGTNSNTGLTLVAGGALLVNGSQPFSPVSVSSGTLGGTGVVGNISAAGNVAPGVSPGLLTCSNLTLAVNGELFVELNGPLPGSEYDQLFVRGAVTLNNNTLHVSIGAPPAEGDRFTIILNDGNDPVTGTFAGLPNGSVLTVNNTRFHVLYDSGGNDVALVATNTPLRLTGSTTVSAGNFNNLVDPNECNLLTIVVTNVTAAPVTGIRATLLPASAGWSVTQPFSTYPNLAPGARGSNQVPFQVSLMPGWVCGTPFVFDLILETDGYGPFRTTLGSSTGLLGTPVRFDNNIPLPIPDFSSADSTINVSGIGTAIQGVTVSLHITHPSLEDLDISLINPVGLAITLSSDNGGAAANYGTGCADNQRTMFSDLPVSNPLITAGTAPFVGTFRPEVALGNFGRDFGAEVNGLWTLRVADDTGGDIGTLQCWSLVFTPSLCFDGGGSCESCPERTIFGSISVQSQLHAGRLVRDGSASTCGVAGFCPGSESLATLRRYDAYAFENGESNACITVTLGAACNLFSAAYRGNFTVVNLCNNYLADLGNSLGATGGTNSYSFDVAARERFTVVVSQNEPADSCEYRLEVAGGSCRPILNIERPAPSLAVLDWTTAAMDYQLERTNNLAGPSAPQWLPVTPAPRITDSRLRVTNNIGPDTPRFYRLRKP